MKKSSTELGILELAYILWAQKMLIIKTATTVLVIGVVYSLLVPIQYQVKTSMISNSSDDTQLKGNLGGLASLAGINLGNEASVSSIPPILYPKIAQSVPFRQAILETEINLSGHAEPIKFKDYFKQKGNKSGLATLKKYTIGLPKLLKESLFPVKISVDQPIAINENIISISKDEMETVDALEEFILVGVDDEVGLVTLTVRMSEALATAELAQSVQELLMNEVADYKITKAQETLDFVNTLYKEKKSQLEKRRKELASFQDSNMALKKALSRSELVRLQGEYDLALGVYNEVAKQLETAKIQVVKNTPSFTVIEPVVVPTLRKKPLRTLIVLGSGFLGIFLGIGLVFLQAYIHEIKAVDANKSA